MAFLQVLLLLGFLTAFGDEGVGIDPNGRARVAADDGIGIDPFGGRVTADDGSGLDPHGSPRPTGGVCIDPDGACSS